MTKEELIKDQFPNDEFLQSGVLQIVDKCTAELEKENKALTQNLEDSEIIIAELKAQIEKMKCCQNCKYYSWCPKDCSKNEPCEGYNKWELKEIKEK